MWENADQEKLRIWIHFTQWGVLIPWFTGGDCLADIHGNDDVRIPSCRVKKLFQLLAFFHSDWRYNSKILKLFEMDLET